MFLFANVGDDSEHPATIDYVRDVAYPYAEANGITIHTLDRRKRDGSKETLWQRLMRDNRSIDIPIRMANGAPGNRSCTADFKIKVVAKWLKGHGASEENPATVAIGFSTDEFHRTNRKVATAWEVPVWPLIDLGMDRSACQALIARAGIPVPGKSACFFCPFHRPQTWAEQRRDEPELFAKSVELEDTLNRRRDKPGKDHVYLTRFNRPLADAVPEAQTAFDFDGPEGCDTGHCWT